MENNFFIFQTFENTLDTPVFGYLLHDYEIRLSLLQENPNMTIGELSIILLRNWNEMNQDKKIEYDERAKELNWKLLSENEKDSYICQAKEFSINIDTTDTDIINDINITEANNLTGTSRTVGSLSPEGTKNDRDDFKRTDDGFKGTDDDFERMLNRIKRKKNVEIPVKEIIIDEDDFNGLKEPGFMKEEGCIEVLFNEHRHYAKMREIVKRAKNQLNKMRFGVATILDSLTFEYKSRTLYVKDVTKITESPPDTLLLYVFDEEACLEICSFLILLFIIVKVEYNIKKYVDIANRNIEEEKRNGLRKLQQDLQNGIPEDHIEEHRKQFLAQVENFEKDLDKTLETKLSEYKSAS
nr:10900_t:CDS:2 [Entrophospora candida]